MNFTEILRLANRHGLEIRWSIELKFFDVRNGKIELKPTIHKTVPTSDLEYELLSGLLTAIQAQINHQ